MYPKKRYNKRIYMRTNKINSRIGYPIRFKNIGISDIKDDDITILPTISIEDNKADLNFCFPYEENVISYYEGRINLQKNIKVFKLQKEEVESTMMNEAFKSIGQLIVIEIYERKIYKNKLRFTSSSCVFSILDICNDHKILTSFHDISEKSLGKEVLLIFNFDIFDEYLAIKHIMSQIITPHSKLKLNQVIAKFTKEAEKQKLIKVELLSNLVNNKFLQLRKKVILESYAERYFEKNILLDPEYFLQPYPSIDCVILNISEKLRSFIMLNEIKGIKVDVDYKTNHKEDSIYYACTYNFDEYVFEDTDWLEDVKTKHRSNLIIQHHFLHRGKFVSLMKIRYDNDHLITNNCSLTVGSSGAPILTKNGNLIGISNGFYEDEIKPLNECITENNKVETDWLFDRCAANEKVENYAIEKNANLAISIRHKIFDYFFKSLSSEDKNDSNDLFLPLKEEKDVVFKSEARRKSTRVKGKISQLNLPHLKEKEGNENLLKKKQTKSKVEKSS